MKTDKKFRLEWVDYAKAIAIILVVYRHILIGVQRSGIQVAEWLINANEVVYSFRMPLFFVLSGIFTAKSIAKRNGKEFLSAKFDSIYYPYLVWGIIQISIQIILSQYTNAERNYMDYFFLFTNPRAIDQLWYLSALFSVSLFFYVLYGFARINNYFISLLAILLFGGSLYVQEISLVHDLFYYFLFFVVGHLIGNIMLNHNNYNFFYSYKPFLILTVPFWLSQWYWLHHQDMNLYLFAIIALLGTAYVFSISFILAHYNYASFLKVAGRYSLRIYLMHLLIVSAVRICFTQLLGVTEPTVILLVGWFLGVFLPIIFYKKIKSTVLVLLFKPSLSR